jgi:hypothetical protein
MANVKCFNCGTHFGYEQNGNKLNLGGRAILKDSATFGCETCGTLQTWEAGKGTRKSDEFERSGGQSKNTRTGAVVQLPQVQ